MERWNVGILLFSEVEVLDFAGPFEVFSRARTVPGVESRRDEASAPFRVFTVARERRPIAAVGGLVLQAHHTLDAHPPIDVLVVPGGFGTRALLEDEPTLEWIRRVATSAQRVTSVCTGALLLARAGLLDGRRATTHHAACDLLGTLGRDIKVVRQRRVVDDGLMTSGGVSAGIDLALHVVEQRCGRAVAAETASYIEYPWSGRAVVDLGTPDGFRDVLPMLSTREFDKTIAFYTGLLGFTLETRWPEDDPRIAILSHGPVEVAFTRAEDEAPLRLTGQLSFEVADAAALFERLRDRVEILWGMEVYHYGRREFSFRDPNGYALVVSEPTDDPVTCPED